MTAQARVHASKLKATLGGSLQAHQRLQEAVLQLLALEGVPAVPLHTGPRVIPRPGGGYNLLANPAQRGMGDVMSCLPPNGRLWIIELKSGDARRSAAQVRMHERFAAAGAVTTVVRSVEDLAPHLPGARVTPGKRGGNR